MAELTSVGLDVGTTTTQLIVSKLTVADQASSFAVPRLQITDRQVVYESPVRFTPLISGELVDGEAIRALVEEDYRAAGLRREDVDTGAIIITGETSRKENARSVLMALSGFAGDFVVATAGPDLESALAARGASATDWSERTGKPVLHMDIGGGTSNLALIEDGKVIQTGCFNVGGRLVKLSPEGRVEYVSPVLEGLVPYRAGDTLTEAAAMETARLLTRVLEMAAGLRETDGTYEKLMTKEAQGWTASAIFAGGPSSVAIAESEGIATPACALVRNDSFSGKSSEAPPAKETSARSNLPSSISLPTMISFSGGVAECIQRDAHWLEYGDLGVLLGRALRESLLCREEYRIAPKAIRATVIGAGCHSAQLSGSTVYCRDVKLPLKNLEAVCLTAQEQALPTDALAEAVARCYTQADSRPVLSLPGWNAPGYAQVAALAQSLAKGVPPGPVYVAVEADMAKALGQALALRLPPGTPLLCIDSVALEEQAYLDVGTPVGPAFPVVVKTLVCR